MNSLLIFYAIFGIVLILIIFLYQISASREKGNVGFEDSTTFVHASIGYLIMLLNIILFEKPNLALFYVFALVNLFLSLSLLKRYIGRYTSVARNLNYWIILFCSLWVVMGYQLDYSYIDTITPIIFIQCLSFFFCGLNFLLHDEYELSIRNLAGILFLFLALIKLIYLLIDDVLDNLLIGVFMADFMLYLIVALLLILLDYNRERIIVDFNRESLIDSINESPLGILTFNHRGDIINMNQNVIKTLKLVGNYSDEDFQKQINLHDLSKMPFEDEWDKVTRAISRGKSYSVEADVFDSNSKTYEFIFLPAVNYDNEEDPYGLNSNILCLVLNVNREYSVVTRVEEMQEEDFYMPNRYQLMELFEHGIKHKLKKHFAVVLVKIVNYDAITNIVNTHEIATIDQMVKKKLEKLDFTYCIGKVSIDTFELITDDVYDVKEVKAMIESIKEILNQQSFYDDKMNVYSLDYRMGVAMAPEDGFTQRELLRAASIAVTKASDEDLGYVQYYNTQLKHELATKLQLETKLRDSISNQQLFLEYQPQFKMNTHEIRGFEALLRWRMGNGEIVSPNDFIPMAEDLGLMDELGDWVLEEAIKEATKWYMEYKKDWVLSVNVSLAQVEQEGFADNVLNIVDRYDYPTQQLEIELTETKMAKSSDRVFIELKQLQEAGIKIAIDDFGTGYSSLDYLRWLPFNVLKIDKGFIEGLEENGIDYAIVNSVIELVNNLDCETIAEGVETHEQLNILKNTRCDYVQGFIYSRPITNEGIKDLIDSSED